MLLHAICVPCNGKGDSRLCIAAQVNASLAAKVLSEQRGAAAGRDGRRA